MFSFIANIWVLRERAYVEEHLCPLFDKFSSVFVCQFSVLCATERESQRTSNSVKASKVSHKWKLFIMHGALIFIGFEAKIYRDMQCLDIRHSKFSVIHLPYEIIVENMK